MSLATPPDALPAHTDRRAIGVLVVDDDALVRTMTADRLTGLGYRVEAVGDAGAALAKLEATPEAWNVLVTDEVMPGLTGSELAAAAHTLRPDLPVILCTGTGRPPAVPVPHVLRVLEKPCRLEALDRAILSAAGQEAVA